LVRREATDSKVALMGEGRVGLDNGDRDPVTGVPRERRELLRRLRRGGDRDMSPSREIIQVVRTDRTVRVRLCESSKGFDADWRLVAKNWSSRPANRIISAKALLISLNRGSRKTACWATLDGMPHKPESGGRTSLETDFITSC